ncbi:MAG TPA: 16S rRNA (guanine(527)-N(7))-methyltransferase RsmG [Oleiagrimonas sp.]|nr:16S rRNA (guanine(527)-N(7))-methyltransferase RsmG [Oleiagrimonas sp.]
MDFPRHDLERRLGDGLRSLDLTLTPDASARLLDYLQLLARWNRSFNLTAVRDPAAMVTRHLLDSLAIAPHLQGTSAADLGSGAGLPGIPLAIAAPERQWLLVDSNGKKARFLRAAVRELDLANVQVAQQRVEDVQGRFDCVTARAFASLPDMLAWGGHLLAPSGLWLAMKGRRPDDELAALPPGFTLESETTLAIPGLDAARQLLALRRSGA